MRVYGILMRAQAILTLAYGLISRNYGIITHRKSDLTDDYLDLSAIALRLPFVYNAARLHSIYQDKSFRSFPL